MKTRHDLAALIAKRLDGDMFLTEPGWPRTFAVDLPKRDELESDAPRFLDIDEDTRRWAGRCGIDVDERGNPIRPREPKPLHSLTDAERSLYTFLCTGADGGHPRLEQERVPTQTVADRLHALGFPLA